MTDRDLDQLAEALLERIGRLRDLNYDRLARALLRNGLGDRIAARERLLETEDRLITEDEVKSLLGMPGCSRGHIWRLEKDGKIPKSVRSRPKRWWLSDIQRHLSQSKAS